MPNPYNFSYSEAIKSYCFITKNDVEYRVAFVIDETFSVVSNLDIRNIYQLVIEKTSDGIERLDIQVSETIRTIISSFFQNSQNAMIYVCDDGDLKGKKRFNAFNRWYQNSTLTDIITKIDTIIIGKYNGVETQIYSSLLYHKDNVNKEILIEIYNTIQEILNEK